MTGKRQYLAEFKGQASPPSAPGAVAWRGRLL